MSRIDFKALILSENKHFVLINKPASISVLEDRNDATNILGMARAHYPDMQAAHRLDKETSGVLALAKTPEAYRHLAMQFEARTVVKSYHAVLDGIAQFKNETVALPLFQTAGGKVRVHKGRGKEATTILDTIEVFKKHCLVHCRPVTGRTHQIRVHLQAMGFPITGDHLYGGRSFLLSQVKPDYRLQAYKEERPLMNRIALHAARLEFKDIDGASISVEAPYPKDFKALLSQLRKNR